MSSIDPVAKRAWLDEHLATAPPLSQEQREEIANLIARQERGRETPT